MTAERKCLICGGPGRPKADTCAKCAGWWRYHSLKTAAEYGNYVSRVNLASTRISKRRAVRRAS